MLSTLGLKQGKLKEEREKRLDEWVREKLPTLKGDQLNVHLGSFKLSKQGGVEDRRSRLKQKLVA